MRRFILILSRFIFYAAVGWLCFGIGIGACIAGILIELKYRSWTTKEVKTSKKSIAPIKPGESIIPELPNTVRVKCQDKSLKPVWEKLLKDEGFAKQFDSWKNNPEQVFWWRNVISGDNTQIQTNLTEIIFDCADLVTFKKIDLNDDGIQEIAVKPKLLFNDESEGIMKIYQQKNDWFEEIFESKEMFLSSISDNKMNEFRNIHIWTIAKIQGHACESDMYRETYKFNGEKYEKASRKLDGDLYTVYERENNNKLLD